MQIQRKNISKNYYVFIFFIPLRKLITKSTLSQHSSNSKNMDNQETTIILDQIEQEEINFDRPSLLTRIKSMVADGIVIIVLMFIASIVLNALNIESGLVRGITLSLILLYEPIMVAVDRTIGQRIMGLRVSKYSTFVDDDTHQNINIFYSLFRFVVKGLLGWLSLLTIHGNTYGQAIHDKMADSVMIFE